MNKKIVAIGILGILLLMITATAYPIENKKIDVKTSIATLNNDETYVGYMSVFPGDPLLYENWKLIAEINPDFGGEDKTFDLQHGESITLTAEYEIIDDAPFPEDWTFTLYTYGLKNDNWDPIKNTFEHIFDELGPDNSCTGELSVTIVCDQYSKIFAKLWVDYWRLAWDGWEMLDKSTDIIDINIFENQAPNPPDIAGPPRGKVGEEYAYSFKTADPEEDNIFYWVDWGDETNSGWIGPYISGKEITISHTWSILGTYKIKAKAKDDYNGAESDWRYFEVSMPRSKSVNINSLFLKLLEQFPLLERLLELL